MQEIHITDENKTYVVSPYLNPIANVADGETVKIYTWDCFTNALTDNSQIPSETINPHGNPQTGPIYIDGAEPGDILAVTLIDITPTRNWAVSAHLLNGGGLESSIELDLLHQQIEEKTFIYNFDGFEYCYNDRLHFPADPFLGTIATANDLESISSAHPFRNGGNMDCPVIKPGNTVYLPVSVKGAYFYTGDCHIRQGDGEACAVAMETAACITAKFDVIKNKRIPYPRVESETEFICIGIAAPMENAAKQAYISLIKWMEEYGWTQEEAYQAVTMAGRLTVGSFVSREFTMIASISKDIMFRAR